MLPAKVRELMMPGRLAALRQMVRFLASKGVFGPDALQDGLNSKKYKTLSPGEGSGPAPSLFRDFLFVPPFTVPFSVTVNVSGGGAALQAAVIAAAAGTRLLITDSLNYSGVVFTGKTNITIEAAAGQTPTITAAAGQSQSAMRIGAGNSGIALKRLALIGNGNQNGLSQSDNGILLGTAAVTGMATFDRLIVDSCTFSELNPALGVPGIQLIGTNGLSHTDVWVKGCTFTDCSTPAFATGAGYGACTVGGFDLVVVQNSKILRVAVARAASHMRGVVLKNLDQLVQDVLCFDIGSAGSNECFKHNDEAIFGTAVGNGNWKNCVAFNAKRAFRITLSGAGMKVSNATVYNAIPGVAVGQILMRRDNAPTTFLIEACVIQGAGDGTAFSATAVENHNDVFNVAAPGKVLDPTDLTVDPMLSAPIVNDYRATDPSVATGGLTPGTPMGVAYPGGDVIVWAGVP
jgi:hypothetical protein